MEKEPKSGEQIFEELRGIWERAMGGDKMMEINDKIVGFAEKLQAEHKDIHDYLLYHLLVGSTPAEGGNLKFDLSNGEIENFIRSLENEF